jgi:hypothetical protein
MVSGALGKISIDCAYLSDGPLPTNLIQWRSTLGPGGGTGPPNVGQAPPQIFGQLNFFLETGSQEIIELSILSHIACYLT